MHALQRLLREGLVRRGWNQSDLARESGLSKQVVSKLLREGRAPIARLLRDTTIEGLARALQVHVGVVRAAIAEEMRLPGGEVQVVYDARGVADDELVRELARRLGAASAARSAEDGGPRLSLVLADPVGTGIEPERADVPASTPETVTWAARAGEPDQPPGLVDGSADQSPGGRVQDDPEGPDHV